jgi:diaminohydroxyphosphoribosylaminopyrimidine deaminase/5-amino-6-(5-phosphoribosylamino)uracil reductase
MQNDHCYYMGLALEEAKKGVGRTSPNPAVGALIVKDGVIVGKGYHKKAGTPHAEVHALHAAGLRAQGATLYVTLEPCNHTGKTPPCTEAVLRAGIAQVIIGMPDPNPKVAGGGAEYLKSQGIVVCSGILEHQCRALNNPFIKHSRTGLPWVIMKAGLSLDGKITFHSRQGAALTGPESLRSVHHLRNQVDAILIGVETAIIDDPSLTTRLEHVEEKRDPLRIVLDSGLRLPEKARMLHQVSIAETWIICGERASREKEARLLTSGAKVFRLPTDHHGRIDLSALLRFLGNNNITSLLVEGGARIHGAMYQQHVDEICLFYAPYIIGDQGTPLVSDFCLNSRAEAPRLSNISVQMLGNDVLFRALVQR